MTSFFKDLLKEVRSQSHNTRHLMFGLSVVATISIVGLVWFHSFSRSMYALLNPGQAVEQRAYADNSKTEVRRSFLGRGVDSLRAAVYSVLHLDDGAGKKSVDATASPVYVLPLSPDR